MTWSEYPEEYTGDDKTKCVIKGTDIPITDLDKHNNDGKCEMVIKVNGLKTLNNPDIRDCMNFKIYSTVGGFKLIASTIAMASSIALTYL